MMLSTEAYHSKSASSGVCSWKSTYICSNSQEKYPNNDDEHVEHHSTPTSDQASLLVEVRPILCATHSQICHAPENPAKEGIEQRAHKRQKICKEWDNLCNDKGKDPSCCQNTGPGRPADDGVMVLMTRAFEDTEEDKAGGDGGVEDAEEDQGRDHER
jgi:hypothetical protein